MHTNQNMAPRIVSLPVNAAGRVVCRRCDQTPTTKQFLNEFGLYDSDITMLMKASDSGDKSLFDALASRLSMVVAEPDNGKTIQQLFDEWKPAYIQTASELQAWPAYLKDVQPEVYERLYGDDDRKFEASLKTDSNVKDGVSDSSVSDSSNN